MSAYLINISEALGRFHPVVVHLPIGILLLGVLLYWLSENPKYAVSQSVLKLVFIIGIAGALVSTITGFLLSNSGDYEGGTVALHMWLGIGTTAFALLVFARMVQPKKDPSTKYLALLLALLIGLTGHFGGSLTHGDDFLFAGWRSEEKDSIAVRPIADVQQANVYADVVQPILQTRCYSCHGAQKQKGGLRMDDSTRLMKGGKGGEIIVPGNATESELIKRLLLPREHEDHMPPKQKPQLTEAQVALLHWWIEAGAPFQKNVAALQQPEAIRPVLAALEEAPVKKSAPLLPEVAVSPADEKATAALRAKGVVLQPVAKESNYLAANFVAASFSDGDAALLQPLQQQLLWVKFGGQPIGDAVASVLGGCGNLHTLYLNETRISDKGLAALSNLKNLRTLSLVGTGVTLNGLAALKKLTQLERLFLYGTGIQKSDISTLKNMFPNAVIDFGGYQLQALPSDTQQVQAPAH